MLKINLKVQICLTAVEGGKASQKCIYVNFYLQTNNVLIGKTSSSLHTKGGQDTAELCANTDANHTLEQLFFYIWQIFFFLMLTKAYVVGFKEFLTF